MADLLFDTQLRIPVRTPLALTASETAGLFESPFVKELVKTGNFFGNTRHEPVTTNNTNPEVQLDDPLLFRVDAMMLDCFHNQLTADISIIRKNWEPYLECDLHGICIILGNTIGRRFRLIRIDGILVPPKG